MVYKRVTYLQWGHFVKCKCRNHLILNYLNIKWKEKQARTNFSIDFKTFKVAGLMLRPRAELLPLVELPFSSQSSSPGTFLSHPLSDSTSVTSQNRNLHCWIWTLCWFHRLLGRGWDSLVSSVICSLSAGSLLEAFIAQVAMGKVPVEWRPFGVSRRLHSQQVLSSPSRKGTT